MDYNPPLRSSRQDIRGSFQFFHGDYHNGNQEERNKDERHKVDRQQSQPTMDNDNQPYFPIRRQLSSDTINLKKLGLTNKGGGDSFFLGNDSADGEVAKTNFADLNKIRSNGDEPGLFSNVRCGDGELSLRVCVLKFLCRRYNKNFFNQNFTLIVESGFSIFRLLEIFNN